MAFSFLLFYCSSIPIFWRKSSTLFSNLLIPIRANRVRRPMSQAVVNRVAVGLAMQKMPRTTSRMPAIASQILVLFIVISI